jgi:hypothetical protein
MKITEINSDSEELHKFAESFGHKIDPRWKTLIAINEKTGEWLGYLQVIDQPSTISGWKRPGMDTIKAIKAMDEFCSECGIGITWCEQKSPFYPYMERLGFQKSGIEVFFSLPKEKNKAN